ncbi:MAG: hypothetical protein AAGU12_12365 [Clostridiales bacterium]
MTDSQLPLFTAKHRGQQEEKGFCFTFFCDLCNNSYTTPVIAAEDYKTALLLGERDGRLHFNRCQCCHRWVCDEHFNENRMMCTDCLPRICGGCGAFVPKGNQFCTTCGKPQFEEDK